MRRRFFNIKKLLNNFINYSSSDNQIVTPYIIDFGSVLLKNVMIDGIGTLLFKSNVTKIGNYAFASCTSLTSITIPNSVTTIGDAAFFGCTSLKSITIPNSVTEMGDRVFYGCTSMDGFYGKFASEDNRFLIIDGEMVTFAPYGLTEYSIPNSVTTIGEFAFMYCDNLTSVTIPNSVTSIGSGAFYGCSSLTSITIPDSVTSIGVNTFSSCTSLTSVYCRATKPPTLKHHFWSYASTDCKIYVPYQSLDLYKTARYWSESSDDIVGYDFENNTIVREIITFTINNVEYQAEEGMTWGEWCNSEYNTSAYFVSGSTIFTAGGGTVQLNGSNVVNTDIIISTSYTHTSNQGQ